MNCAHTEKQKIDKMCLMLVYISFRFMRAALCYICIYCTQHCARLSHLAQCYRTHKISTKLANVHSTIHNLNARAQAYLKAFYLCVYVGCLTSTYAFMNKLQNSPLNATNHLRVPSPHHRRANYIKERKNPNEIHNTQYYVVFLRMDWFTHRP